MTDRTAHISKVYVKSSKRKVEYATLDYILESLHLMKARDDLPVFRLLNILADGNVDSVSFGRDDPHCYFYARAHKEYISMIIRKSGEGKDIEFQIPYKMLKLAMKDSDEDLPEPQD